jgi:hypothetical protein
MFLARLFLKKPFEKAVKSLLLLLLRGATARGIEFAAWAILGLPAIFARGAMRVGGAGHLVEKAKHVWLGLVCVCFVLCCVFILVSEGQNQFSIFCFFFRKALLTKVQSKLL